jgi:Na+/proline symporter
MKPLLRSWSPLQLLWLIGISNAIATVTVFTLAIEKWHSHGHPTHPSVILPGILVFLAIVGSFLAESALQNGIKSDLWSDAQWAMPRKLVRHPVIWAWIGALAAFILVYGISHLGSSGLGTFILPAELSLIRVSSIVQNRKRTEENLSSLNLSATRSLRSDNWGH